MSRLTMKMAQANMTEQYLDNDQSGSCLSGLYVLTAQGSLARLDAEGTPVMEPVRTVALSDGIDAVLNRYRKGDVEGLVLGLVTASDDVKTGRMHLADDLLTVLFESGRGAGMSLTPYEARHKVKSLAQAMELVLNKKRAAEPFFPYFCPVLISPEVDDRTLCERYGADIGDAGVRYEVLDLAAPFLSNHCPPEALFQMRAGMRRAQTGGDPFRPNRDTQDDQVDVEPATEAVNIHGGMAGIRLPAVNDTFFKDGDAVTGWLLAWFSPFNELTETQRDIIAGYETIRKVRAGSRLIERGSVDDTCVFLVEGVLELLTEDGETMRISGGTRRSRLPISPLSPHCYEVTAVTDASVIVFSQALVHKINEITRTYTGVNRNITPEASTAAISNGVQSVYFTHAEVKGSDSER